MTAEVTGSGDPRSGHGSKRRLWPKAIAALLAAKNTEQAAKAVGVSRETLGRWQADDAFQAALEAARRDVVSTAITGLQTAIADAVAALRRNLAAEAPSVQVSAARALLEYGFRAREVEVLEKQVAMLEERVRLADKGTQR